MELLSHSDEIEQAMRDGDKNSHDHPLVYVLWNICYQLSLIRESIMYRKPEFP